ncbi:MAG: sulfur carrier protein ThiS [Gammaproteobacteria bacterium]|nr:sulfur carrier protein ThiS [Gammaproteobacteria bacterium]
MRVIVNGDEVELPADATLIDLLQMLELGSTKVAVELNQSIVPRSRHAVQRLQQGDCVEIVYAIGGG